MVFMLLFKLLGRIVSAKDRIWLKSDFKVSNQMCVEHVSHTQITLVLKYMIVVLHIQKVLI